MADVFSASPGQQVVGFSMLVKRAAEAAFVNLKELTESCPEQSDSERKISLLKFIVRTRQRLLRLLVLAKWCRQIPLVDRCQQLAGTISNHDMSFTQAADSLFFLHESLQQARAPSYDVPTAVEVLLTGSYHRLPKCIEDLGMKSMLDGEEREASLQKLDTLLRARLLNVTLPKELSAIKVSEGRVFLTVKGEFEVQLTLGYRGDLSLWRILHLELLVGDNSGSAKLTDMRRLLLGDDLERRMAASDDPFGLLYSILHEFCVALVMDTLFRQVQTLQHGRWKDAIRFEVISDMSTAGHALSAGQGVGQGPGPPADGDTDLVTASKSRSSPGLKITYWLDQPKGAGIDAGSLPSLAIEQGPDQQLCCSHKPPLIDPVTDNEAQFLVDQSCLDVERLILKAISCNIHSRLLEVERALKNSAQLFRVDTDVILRASGHPRGIAPSSKDLESSNAVTVKDHWARDANTLGEEVLCVRAYGTFYIALGISIRNGRYLLSVPHTLSLDGFISDMEEGLNQGTITPLDMFIYLRNKSLLQLFSTIGTSLNLKVFEKGAISVKYPREQPKLGSDVLVMSFPHCEDLYFLSIQLDVTALPAFTLLEAQSERASAKSVQTQGAIHISRQMKINLETITVTEDDAKIYSSQGSTSAYAKKPIEILSPAPSGSSEKKVTQSSDENRDMLSLSKPGNLTGEGAQPDEMSQHAIQELDSSKSPLNLGDSAVSPLNLDDEDLSKLIDAISSKATSGQLTTLMGSGEDAGMPSETVSSQLPRPSKRRKIYLDDSKSPTAHAVAGGVDLFPIASLEEFVGMSYSNVIAAANQGQVPPESYTTIFLQVVKRCWLCIKHARLACQMDALGVPYVEEVGLRNTSTDLCFRFPSSSFKGEILENCGWQNMRLSLGRPGSNGWEAKIEDAYYVTLWELQRQKTVTDWGAEVLFASLSEADSHIHCTQDGLVLSYESVQDDSITKLLGDLERLRNARAFALGMKKLLECRPDEKLDRSHGKSFPPQNGKKIIQEKLEGTESKGDIIRRAFRVEAVGLTSLWFSYSGSMPGIQARFVVEWGVCLRGCVVHISPEQLWPHTKYLEEYINGGEVELLLDAIRITAGPLHALAGAIRPARMMSPVPTTPGTGSTVVGCKAGTASAIVSPSSTNAVSLSRGMVAGINSGLLGSTGGMLGPIQSVHSGTITSGPGRGSSGPGLVPSSLLPTDISVLLRSAYWIRIVYRKDFAVDMRCFAGDQVWLQPAPPPYSGGPEAGGSLPCPQFRPFVMENVALGLNNPESVAGGPAPGSLGQGLGVIQTSTAGSFSGSASNSKRGIHHSIGTSRSGATATNQGGGMTPRANSIGNALGTQGFSTAPGISLVSGRGISMGSGAGVYPGYRGELNTALFGLGDDGGYGGAWVPLAALKKVLRGTLRYLGVLWLFAQFPSIIREILGSILNGREGTLLHLDAEQPALRFHVGTCMFAVSMHRHQLYLQAVNVKRFHPQQQQQQQAQSSGADTELSTVEMSEIGDFFARRVTSEPYDASRLASFVTMLTLPVPVLREFLVLISWKKDIQKACQIGEPVPRPRVELCLENRMGLEKGSEYHS
ncbi:hypothetical protein O6H91_06G132500 [Diphasiastrum complanatum]|uniref:Uncharacterized protein n=1 Tax=Diphasiastrum complanatum TaxID=34168 RepID=A0ACC2DJ88_DIPCM|nr:hypothetical protein O6H91_06G132500 [Diphasiastrum complanatum]